MKQLLSRDHSGFWLAQFLFFPCDRTATLLPLVGPSLVCLDDGWYAFKYLQA
jgi:hypothetical protein